MNPSAGIAQAIQPNHKEKDSIATESSLSSCDAFLLV